MKLMKNLAAALLLASVLSVNASAGDQHTGGAAPTPTPSPATSPASDTKDAETTKTQEPSLADELWSDALLALLSFY